jgi:DNA-binding MarR family transcriptional regulator
MDDDFLLSQPPLSMRLFLVMLQISVLVNEQSNAHLHDFGITGARLSVLFTLFQARTPLAPSELGRRLAVSRANISLLLTALEQKGLIERIENKEDGRFHLAQLTESGQTLLRQSLPIHRATVQHAMAGLTDEEQAQMLFLAGKLIGSLQERVREGQENEGRNR